MNEYHTTMATAPNETPSAETDAPHPLADLPKVFADLDERLEEEVRTVRSEFLVPESDDDRGTFLQFQQERSQQARKHQATPEEWLAAVPDKMNFAAEIGQRISQRRKQLGWSQKKLAELYGVSREHISKFELGNAEINAGDLPRMAAILNVSITFLFGLAALTDGSPKLSSSATLNPAEEDLLQEYRKLLPSFKQNVVEFVRSLNTSFRSMELQEVDAFVNTVSMTPEQIEEQAFAEALGED